MIEILVLYVLPVLMTRESLEGCAQVTDFADSKRLRQIPSRKSPVPR